MVAVVLQHLVFLYSIWWPEYYENGHQPERFCWEPELGNMVFFLSMILEVFTVETEKKYTELKNL